MMKFQLSFERLNGQKVVTIDATTSYEIGLFSSIIIDTKDEIYIFDFSLSYFYNWLQKRLYSILRFSGFVRDSTRLHAVNCLPLLGVKTRLTRGLPRSRATMRTDNNRIKNVQASLLQFRCRRILTGRWTHHWRWQSWYYCTNISYFFVVLLLALIDKRALYTNDRRCRLEEQPYRSLCITILEVTIETNHSVRTQYTLLACHLELHETTELHGFVDSAVHPNLYHRERNEQAAVYATADDSETTSVVVLSSISSSLS